MVCEEVLVGCAGQRRAFHAACAIALLLISCGCGKTRNKDGQLPVFPVQGSITFQGEPLAFANITLIPVDESAARKQRASAGVSDEDGNFSLSTYDVNDGAPEGQYYITVSCENREAKKISGEYPELLPVRYQSPSASRLTASVIDGDNEPLVLDLVK